MSNRWWLALAAAGILALTASAQDKDSFTPMPLDAGFGKLDLSEPTTPPDEIIKKFAAKESEFQEALNHYTYRRLARVQTIDDDTTRWMASGTRWTMSFSIRRGGAWRRRFTRRKARCSA